MFYRRFALVPLVIACGCGCSKQADTPEVSVVADVGLPEDVTSVDAAADASAVDAAVAVSADVTQN